MMDADEFLNKFSTDILDSDSEIRMDTPLKDIDEWDSLALVSFIAMANTTGGHKITRLSVQNAYTVGDLFKLLG